MRRKKKHWKIYDRPLGREQAYGLCHHNRRKIEIDPRLRSREYLKTLIHELLHAALPELSEKEIVRITMMVYSGVWKKNYRRIQQ